MSKARKVTAAILVVLTLLLVAHVVRILVAVDWQFKDARTTRGIVAAMMAYSDYLFLPSSRVDKPFNIVIEIHRDGQGFHIVFLPRRLQFGGGVEYVVDGKTLSIVSRRYSE